MDDSELIELVRPLLAPRTRNGKRSRQARIKIITGTNGYKLVFDPTHQLAMRNGYVYVHRLLVASRNTDFTREKHVHHEDECRENNDPDNLAAFNSAAEHNVVHRKSGKVLRKPGEENPVISCECGCGAMFSKYDRTGRPRRYVSGHNERSS